ncbi:uncharacterized protein LOC119767441 [Culex quinquefasciatus]|uniref:uncharacterized protein LOC119767441 n=1 Tax=Culex quinquefasciatus TaxID=7176 RepID=UPI0018E33216|nr:uncharacterized protein LOC119767441 [Culex quinquefasciatus]
MEVEETSERDDFQLIPGNRKRKKTPENVLSNNKLIPLAENENNNNASPAGGGDAPAAPPPGQSAERRKRTTKWCDYEGSRVSRNGSCGGFKMTAGFRKKDSAPIDPGTGATSRTGESFY